MQTPGFQRQMHFRFMLPDATALWPMSSPDWQRSKPPRVPSAVEREDPSVTGHSSIFFG